MIRNLLILIASLFPLAGAAQGSLVRLASSIEDSKDVSNIIYTEKRDPATRKLIKSTRLILFSDPSLAKRVVEAIRREREKSVSYQETYEGPARVYQIEFDDNNGSLSRYTLIRDGIPPEWTFSIQTYYNPPARTRRK